MRICVVGCGAVGSLFAANLSTLDDVEVWAFDLNQAHVDAIKENGLQLTGAGEVRRAPAGDERCGRDPAVRLRDRRDEGDARRRGDLGHRPCLRRRRGRLVMNGVGNEETLAEHVERVIRGTTFPAGKLLEPGVVAVGREGRHDASGRSSRARVPVEAIEPLADACTRAGMPAHGGRRRTPGAVAEGDLQRGDEPDGRAHRA